MGRKLGNGLIIFGIINFIISVFLVVSIGPTVLIGGLIWLTIMIVLGTWQRSKAEKEEKEELDHERELELREREVYAKEKVNDSNLADAINKVLDEREHKKGGAGIS